jgi:hypothetical protein
MMEPAHESYKKKTNPSRFKYPQKDRVPTTHEHRILGAALSGNDALMENHGMGKGTPCSKPYTPL